MFIVEKSELHDPCKETDDFEKTLWLQRHPLIVKEEGNSCTGIMDPSERSDISAPDVPSLAEMRQIFFNGKNPNYVLCSWQQ